MKILFLGTGSVCGVPEWNCDCAVCCSDNPKDKRLRSALFVQINNTNIAIDFGPDFRAQLLYNNIRTLDHVLLTHAHGDHMNGYHELSRQKNLIVSTPQTVLLDFYDRLNASKDWLEKRNPSLRMKEFEPFSIGDFTIDSIELEHKKDYATTGTPCYGYLFHSSNFTFAYTTDCDRIVEQDKVRGIDLLIMDGNGMDSKNGHAGVNGSIEIYNQLQPKQMLLTHINHTTSHASLTEYLQSKGDIEVAYDGLSIETAN